MYWQFRAESLRISYSFLDCSSHIKTNIIWQEHNVQIIKVIGMLNHTHLLGLQHCLGSQWWELAMKTTNVSVKGFKRLHHPRVMPTTSSLHTTDLYIN